MRSTRSAPYRARGWRARWTGLRAIATAASSRRSLISATRCWRRPDSPMDALPLDFEIVPAAPERDDALQLRSEEHTSELQSLMRTSYAVFCLKKKKHQTKCER